MALSQIIFISYACMTFVRYLVEDVRGAGGIFHVQSAIKQVSKAGISVVDTYEYSCSVVLFLLPFLFKMHLILGIICSVELRVRVVFSSN